MLSKMMTGFVINFLLIVNCISNLAQEQQDDGLTDTVPVLNETISHNGEGNSTIECVPRNLSESELPSVRLVNSTAIQEYLESQPNSTQSECVIVLFYFPFCVFSARAAPHYNAIGRLYPQLHVLAIDANINNGINMRFGLVGVPSTLFIQSNKVVAKYNDSDPTVEGYVSFINKVSGLSPASSPILTEQDQQGPVPTTPEDRVDFVLVLSWLFVMFCFSYLFGKSAIFKKIVETVRNTWIEAEAQHEHLE